GVAFAPVAISTPVKLNSFTGKALTEGVQLSWTTVSEKNNARFEILRSEDNNNFSVIGAVDGNNNSERIIYYSFLDTNPLKGTNYYQLRQVDYDGKSEKSAVITVNVNGQPVALTAHLTKTNELEVFLSAREGSKADLYLTDISGKVFVSEDIQLNKGPNRKSVPVKNLVPGVYVVTLISGNEKVTVKVFK
uniref:T9SS type A sorting domain-containing protein n=1 Tax=Pseudopedobacter sp. TaxID=1936787 RepID=UPI003342C6D6